MEPPRLWCSLTTIPGAYADWLAPRIGVRREEIATRTKGDLWPRSVWFETPVNDTWMAAYRLASQDGQIVVSELRIFPIEPDRRRTDSVSAGLWSAELLGPRARAPRGGLTARILRQVRIGDHTAEAGNALSWYRRMDLLEGLGFDDASTTAVSQGPKTDRQRPGHPPLLLARLAKAYADAVACGDVRPVESVARRSRLSVALVRDRIHKARVRGLLTGTIRGRSAGSLTPKAKALLTRSTHKKKKGSRR